MNDRVLNGLLDRLLLQSGKKIRLFAALGALFVGTSLFLLSVAIWWNFNELLFGKNKDDAMASTYLIIGKRVTDQNMGKPMATVFRPAEIEEIRKAPQVQDVGWITANHFPIYAMMGGNLGFATELPLESVPDKFIDKTPAEWRWQPGDNSLPIIISSQFLDIYNYVFAPSQGLPQLSESTVKSLALKLKVGADDRNEIMMAHVVGFSDRINSVLAPQSFIDYYNHKFKGEESGGGPSQLILKALDPSDTKFARFLTDHDYSTNSQNLKWSKVRAVVEVVATTTGVLAILIMGISILVFILFIELTVARAHQSLTLLGQIGFGPKFLSGYMNRHFLPMVGLISICSAVFVCVLQFSAHILVHSQGLVLPPLPGAIVWISFLICSALLVVLIMRSIKQSIKP